MDRQPQNKNFLPAVTWAVGTNKYLQGTVQGIHASVSKPWADVHIYSTSVAFLMCIDTEEIGCIHISSAEGSVANYVTQGRCR
jgi:hypothetical protein